MFLKTSGNIIVSSKERIYLYEFTQCTHENTQPRFSYIDFLPFKFFVNLNFVPLRLSLAENVIACMNNRYCVAFKVVDILTGAGTVNSRHANNHSPHALDNDYEADMYSVYEHADVEAEEVLSSNESSLVSKASGVISSHNSFESDSLETTTARHVGAAGFPGRTSIDFNVARMVNSAYGKEFEVDLHSQWDQNESSLPANGNNAANSHANASAIVIDSQEVVVMPARASDIKIKLVNEAKAMNVQRISNHANGMYAYNEDCGVQYDIRKLLQICMRSSDPSTEGRMLDILKCMDLKAIYQRSNNNGKSDNDAGLESEYDMGNQQIPSAVSSTKHASRRTLKSMKHSSCVGYALLVTSSVDGYLYQFCAQGDYY